MTNKKQPVNPAKPAQKPIDKEVQAAADKIAADKEAADKKAAADKEAADKKAAEEKAVREIVEKAVRKIIEKREATLPEILARLESEPATKPEGKFKAPEKISEHIRWEEAIGSDTAKAKNIDNIPTPEIVAIMKGTAERLFEPLRRFWKIPIAVISFYRSPKTDKALKDGKGNLYKRSKKISQHTKGQAIDIDAHVFGNISNRQIFEYILNELVFDQLIWEFGTDQEPDWVHVSYAPGPRMQVLKSLKGNLGVVKYINMKSWR